jgi:hypothetical protein
MYDDDCAQKIIDVVTQFFKRTSADWTFTTIKNSTVTRVDEGYEQTRAYRLNYTHSSHLRDGEVIFDYSPDGKWITVNPRIEERIVNLATFEPKQEEHKGIQEQTEEKVEVNKDNVQELTQEEKDGNVESSPAKDADTVDQPINEEHEKTEEQPDVE